MTKTDKWKLERDLQKALVLAFVTDHCIKNKLSLEKLQKERFYVSYNECMFAHPSEVKPSGLTNDKETMPYVTLIVRLEGGMLVIEETEYTKRYLSLS